MIMKKGARRYFLRNGKDETIAWFDNLLTAVTVSRYINGGELTEADTDLARYALIVFERETTAKAEKTGKNRKELEGDTDADRPEASSA